MKIFLLLILTLGLAHATEPSSKKHIRYQKTEGAKLLRQLLDVHYDAKTIKTPKPVILWIHGGAWKFGNKTHSIKSKAKVFTESGYVLVAMNYRFHPTVGWRDQAADVAAAAKWIQKNIAEYGGDAKQMILMGHSAGSHLAALTAADPTYLTNAGVPYSHIKAAVLLDGAGYDLPLFMKSSKGKYLQLYEEVFGQNIEQLKAASPRHYFDKKRNTPDFLIIPIAAREITQQQSKGLAKAIKQSGNYANVYSAKDRSHMTLNKKIGEPSDEPTQVILNFLKESLAKK